MFHHLNWINWYTDLRSSLICVYITDKHRLWMDTESERETEWKPVRGGFDGSCRRCYLEASAGDWSQVWWKEEGGRLGGRKAEACLWDQERQEAGESPHQPWAAAFEEPENIYRDLLEISNDKVICYSSQWRTGETQELSNFIIQNHQSHQVTHQHVILNEMVPQHQFTSNWWTLCHCLPVQVEQLKQPQVVMPVYPQAAVALNGRCGWAPQGGQESSSLHSILEKMDMIQTGQHTMIQAAFCYVFVLFPNVSEFLPGDKVSTSSIPPSFSSSNWASLILDQGM